MRRLKLLSFTLFVMIISAPVLSAGDGGQTLHVSDRWENCSFVLDPSLTQDAWHQFAHEAGLVSYFRPMTSAKPMGVKHFEIALINMTSPIEEADPAWHDTFVHPDSAHWLFEGDAMGFPLILARVGITDKIDGGLAWIYNPGTNYGYWGGQIQYNLLNDPENGIAAAVRASTVFLYGPSDLNMGIYGLDAIVSKDMNWFSPYAGVSTYLARAHETTTKVDLDDESIFGVQAMIGVAAKISLLRIGAEINFAEITTTSILIGVGF